MKGRSADRHRTTGASERLKTALEGLEPAGADDTEGLERSQNNIRKPEVRD